MSVGARREAFEAAAEFDAYADDYEHALQLGLRYSGEGSDYFARGRVDALRSRLTICAEGKSGTALDFGCGRGSTAPLLLEIPGIERVVGVDLSERLVHLAAREFGSDRIAFRLAGASLGATVDIAYCNGVFHHVPVAERLTAARYVFNALRPGGTFALCENNPWNPGTRLVMRSIPFDREASPLSPPASRRLLRLAGFEIAETVFLFFFPRSLRAFRRWEHQLTRVPVGAQYMVLAHRPVSADVCRASDSAHNDAERAAQGSRTPAA